ncbi:MAG: TonB-dependent receptor [Caulobacter sp.]|nr:TonB-dependent receptor [Caulobacter sp.]
MKTTRKSLLATTMLAAVCAVPLTIVALPGAVAQAQDYTSGILTGSVVGEDGQPVAGAAVTLHSSQGVTRSTTTAADGSFRIPALAVGAYTIHIEASGLNAIDQTVSVSPSGSAYVFTARSGSVDELVVTGRRVSDFSRQDTGLSVDVQDVAARVPIGRSITSVTLLTPGASPTDASINANGVRRQQSTVSLSGTSAAESAYYFNGLNVTDQRTLLGYTDLPFDFIQTIETKTGGYSAEYGRATGGVVNMVSRSGTNEFHFGISTYVSPDSLRGETGKAYAPGGNNISGYEVFNKFSGSESKETTIWAGGPIIPDRLFFFGAYNFRDQEALGPVSFANTYTNNAFDDATTPGSAPTSGLPYTTAAPEGSQITTRSNDPRWAAKFDLVITDDHRLEATILSDAATTDYRTYRYDRSFAKVGENARYWAESGGLNTIVKYTGVFTDWFTLSALYGRTESSYTDYGPAVVVPGVRDFRASATSPWLTDGRQTGAYNLSGDDTRETFRIDADFYFDLAGSHHVRTGYDREDLVSVAQNSLNGGAYYYVSDSADCPPGGTGSTCIERLTFSNVGKFEAEQSAFYIQDSWRINDRLTLQLGVRNDIYDYKNISGKSYVSTDDQWAPRLGFNWDPTGEGLQRIYGSVSDYYLPLATNTSIRASSGEVYTDTYFNLPAGGLTIGADGAPVLGTQFANFYYSPPGAPDPRGIAEEGLKPMYEREFVLGYERTFEEGPLADWTFGGRLIYRNLESVIEDTVIGDAVVRYCERKGLACGQSGPGDSDFASLFAYVLVNPGDGARVLVDLNGDPRTLADGSPNPDYDPQLINFTAADLNLPKAERTYKAIELTFQRPFDGVWGIQGSYTWSRSRGNYEGAVKSDVGQTDTSITQDFDHSANLLGAYGYLPNHREHSFKVFGNWSPIRNLSIGGNFTAQSGRPYGCIGRVPASVDPLAPQVGTPSGWFCPTSQTAGQATGTGTDDVWAVTKTPRGSGGFTDWTYQVDLNLSYTVMDSEERGRLVASVDVFNLFDSEATTRVVEQGAIRNSANAARPAPYYGLPRNYQSPRSVRFGLKYSF